LLEQIKCYDFTVVSHKIMMSFDKIAH